MAPALGSTLGDDPVSTIPLQAARDSPEGWLDDGLEGMMGLSDESLALCVLRSLERLAGRFLLPVGSQQDVEDTQRVFDSRRVVGLRHFSTAAG